MTHTSDIDALAAAAEKATPGPWELDEIENRDDRGRFTSYAVAATPSWSGYPKHVVDTLNSGVMEVQTEHDEDGSSSWDEQGRADATFIALANPTTILALLNEIKAAREALATIAAWEFPATGRFWDEPKNKEPMSYAAAFGSNGERDYMRAIARAALTPEASK